MYFSSLLQAASSLAGVTDSSDSNFTISTFQKGKKQTYQNHLTPNITPYNPNK